MLLQGLLQGGTILFHLVADVHEHLLISHLFENEQTKSLCIIFKCGTPELVSNSLEPGGLLRINSPTSINNSLAVNSIAPFSGGSITLQAGNVGVAGGDVTIAPTSGGNIFLAGNTTLSGNLTSTGSVITNTVRPLSGQDVQVAGGIGTTGNVTVGGDLVVSNLFPVTGNSVQVNGDATVTGNVVTNNVSPHSGNTVQINGGISTTGSVVAQGNVVATNISTLATDLNLAGNNINLNPASSNVVISGGSTLKVDTISQSTASQPLTITGTGTLNIGGGIVNVSGGSNQSVNITAFGTGKINLVTSTVACNNALTASSATCTGNISGGTMTCTGALTAASATCTGTVSGNALAASSAACTGNISGGTMSCAGALTAASASCTGNVSADSMTCTKGLTAGSATCTGTVTGGALYTTGALTAASASCTGNISGNNLTALTGVTTPGLSGGTGNITVSSQLNCNNGIMLGNGAALMNWYSETSISGTWLNASTTPSTSTTFKLCRIGCIVFVNIGAVTNLFPNSPPNNPEFSTAVPSNFRPSANARIPVVGAVYYSYLINASTGVITIEPELFNANLVFTGHFSYSAI